MSFKPARGYPRRFPQVSPAITEQLAIMNADLTDSHKSLKNLCQQAKDSPLGYAPKDWAPSEQAVWCMGFYEAMTMVLTFINAARPARGSGPDGAREL